MKEFDLIQYRLANQRLAGEPLETPEQVVSWLTAVQAQDFYGAMWSLAQRTRGLSEAEVERAFTAGTILRTHVMRPTWHFVTPSDIRWLLELTARRVHAVSGNYYRRHDLDEATFARSNDVLANALQGGKELTRAELTSALEQAGIANSDDNLRHTLVVMHAELDAVICSGGRRGKQFTYALLDERAPEATRLGQDEARAELARRYFESHGPATLKDFRWWSGMLAGDAQASLDMVASQLACEVIDGETYWFVERALRIEPAAPVAHLLQTYDEYLIGYTDRSAALQPQDSEKLDSRSQTIVVDGKVVGTWQRTLKRGEVHVTARTFVSLTAAQRAAIEAAAARYAAFLGLPLTLSFSL